MIRVGKESKLSTTQVLERAVEFFGPQGVGLEVERWDAASVHLQGGGGYVVVRAQHEHDATHVDIESREWERDAARFLEAI